jgi:redox-sensitive bicupin YhaK (pirin superfamily)
MPIVKEGDGTQVKVVAGEYHKVEGPVKGIPVDPLYLDVTLPVRSRFQLPVKKGYTVFAQAIDGSGAFDPVGAPAVQEGDHPFYTAPMDPLVKSTARAGETILYGDGDWVDIRASDEGLRFLLVSGKPLHEPVAWYGPIVMNTRDEIIQAARELSQGTFIRSTRVIDTA